MANTLTAVGTSSPYQLVRPGERVTVTLTVAGGQTFSGSHAVQVSRQLSGGPWATAVDEAGLVLAFTANRTAGATDYTYLNELPDKVYLRLAVTVYTGQGVQISYADVVGDLLEVLLRNGKGTTRIQDTDDGVKIFGVAKFEQMSFAGYTTPTSTPPLLFTGLVLGATSNVIRGIDVTPTRASGWTSFTGTVSTTPAQVYTDYRELHTNGTAEVLGPGFFTFMDSGASCASLFAGQFIAYASAGSTVLTAGGAPGIGVFGGWFKCVLDGETFNSGGVAAAGFFSVQANVTAVATQNVSIFNIENASGAIKDIFYIKATGGATSKFTNFFTFAAETEPIITWGADGTPETDAPSKGLRVMVGATEYQIPLYVNT